MPMLQVLSLCSSAVFLLARIRWSRLLAMLFSCWYSFAYSQPLDDHLSQTAGVLPHVFPASRFSRLHPRLVSSALLFRLSRVRSRAVFSRPCCFFSLYFSLPFLSPCQLSRSHSDCWCIGSTLDITESDCTMTRSTRSDSSIQLAQTQSTVVHRCKNSLYYTLHGARSGSPK